MPALTEAELQDMYNTVLESTMPDTCTIYNLSGDLLYEGIQCAVTSAATAVEYNATLERYVYEAVFTVTLPKWVQLNLPAGFKIDVLGMMLKAQSLEAPITNQFSQKVRCNWLAAGSTSPNVPPYDLITTGGVPITSGGIGIRIQ